MPESTFPGMPLSGRPWTRVPCVECGEPVAARKEDAVRTCRYCIEKTGTARYDADLEAWVPA